MAVKNARQSITPTHLLGSTGTDVVDDLGYATIASVLAMLMPVGTAIKLPYSVTLTSGLWTSPAGLIYYAPNGNSIGSASSGAAVANAITEDLYLATWENGWDVLTSAGGATSRGANAAADWAANKRLVVPDYRGRVDVMAGQGSGLTDRVVGTQGGAETHALVAAENGPHAHQISPDTGNGTGGSGFYNTFTRSDTNTYNRTVVPSVIQNVGTSSSGSGTPHNNMQPWAAKFELWFVGVEP